MKKILCLFIFVLGFAGTLSAKVTLPSLVGDNMVLQQQSDVKIWGWSQPNATIKIATSWGIKGTVRSDSEGNWLFTVATPSASYTSHTITVSDGEPVVLKNVLIGEVWLCSGQSNMEMTFTGYWGSPVLGAQQAIEESGLHPGLRLFTVEKNSATLPQKDCKGSWQVSSPAATKNFSAVGYYYGLELQRILDVPVGVINSSWGGTIIEAWIDAESQKSFKDVDLNLLNDEKFPVYGKPVSCYNGMISPLVNYSVRGFIWYQGESNVPRYSTYADKMVTLIKFWRKLWNNDNIPFYYAEIAPYNYAANRLDRSEAQINAALLREKQADVMEMINNVGMVCTNDLVYPYERDEIHPSNKPEVARRFAYWALNDAYGYKGALSVIGPRYKSMKIENGKAILSFSGIDGEGLTVKGEITGFEIAGNDRIFHPAKAARVFPNVTDLVISSDQVTEPVAVRYCFRNFSVGNVGNVYGQPMVPFRTDDW
ncbi:sialate O-acetylesterase [bacterium]|nr:sialate O-acetylesterase [bacterium]